MRPVTIERPPVITIMGHVDHGKTTLLDALRHSNIVDTEYGQITQSIGAFTVNTESDTRITFIDTPGHAAFTNMRVRGAKTTDLVIMVVSGIEGIQQLLNVMEVKSGCWFVKNEEDALVVGSLSFAEVKCQFDPLRFSSTERR